MSKTSDTIRTEWAKGDAKRDEGLTTPPEIERFDNLVYGDDDVCQKLDVYRPKADRGLRLPVIVSVHGGAWVYGDKELYQFYCMNLALRGFAVVNFTYRLAPEWKFPASLQDTVLVVEWIKKHAEEYDMDADNVFMVGDSAGAHILGLFCNLCTNPAYASRFDFAAPKDFAPRAVALNCGKYTFRKTSDDDQTEDPELLSDFLPHGGAEDDFDLVEVADYVTSDFPPAFVMTCYNDFLKYQAPHLCDRLIKAVVPFSFNMYGDSKDPLYHVFHVNIRTEAAEKCNDDECAFFAKNL